MSEFARCISAGGIVLFPSDTVYGLCCDPRDADAVSRLYELKGRPPRKPAAIMFFSLGAALAALPDLGTRTRGLLERILPGPVTLLLPNPRELFPLAGGDALGLRVPVSAIEFDGAVLQSSANLAGGKEASRLEDVPSQIRAGVALELDGGELPGVASTVLDLRGYERDGAARVVRQGAFRLP